MYNRIIALFVALMCLFNTVKAQSAKDIDISYQKFVLKNGLRLIVHEDHKAPIVAINVWYHVGSKNEKEGKTGFAHLFEHLMFNGSENFDDDYFQALERIGATDLNGTTNEDRTNYFQNVPKNALDLALWMESDRMGHLLGAVTQAKLDEQRGVVQNEKRQGQNQPYAIAWDLITEATYPKGHPYSWSVIGSMEDLNAASLEDVHEWFKNYYGAANAVLVIAGDVNTEEVKQKVEKYFGDIPSGPPVAKHEVWIAKMTGTKRQTAQDRVPQSRLFKVWNVPESGTREEALLGLASSILSSGKTSRLYKKLVYEKQIATSASAYSWSNEIGGQFTVDAMVAPGKNLAEVEKLIDEELQKFLKEGPTQKELDRVRTQYFAGFVRGVERIGGFGGKSDRLAQNEVYNGSPDAYKTYMKYVEEATIADIKKVVNDWLSDGVYILEIHPFPEYSTVASDVDRKKLPEIGETPDASFPKFEKAKLSNGLNVMLANRKTIPVISFSLMINAGYSADQFAIPGTASLTANMLDEGTKKMNALQISDEMQNLGTYIGSSAGLDYNYLTLNSLKSNLDKSLSLWSEILLTPSFPQDELDKLKKQQIAGIKREKVQPTQMAYRVLPKLFFGEGHAYSLPLTGSGFEESVEKISREDLIKYHQTWYKPNNATLVIVGDVTLSEILPKIEKAFKDWKPGDVPQKNITNVEVKNSNVLYLLDKPAAQQSIILGGHLIVPKSDPDDLAIETMNDILGGVFTSRINMNLREDKHWSYGSFSFFINTKSQRPYIFYGAVQTDKTKESILEMQKEIREYVSTRPATDDELNKIKMNNILSLSGQWETMSAVSSSLQQIVNYNYPENYFDTYSDKMKNLNLTQIHNAANKVIKPEKVIWVVVGDKAKIEPGLKELGFEIKYLDSNGNLIQ